MTTTLTATQIDILGMLGQRGCEMTNHRRLDQYLIINADGWPIAAFDKATGDMFISAGFVTEIESYPPDRFWKMNADGRQATLDALAVQR